MAPVPSDLLRSALALPASDRARLARELLGSLDEGCAADAADAWVFELLCREAEARSGRVSPEDWSAIRKRLTQRWRSR